MSSELYPLPFLRQCDPRLIIEFVHFVGDSDRLSAVKIRRISDPIDSSMVIHVGDDSLKVSGNVGPLRKLGVTDLASASAFKGDSISLKTGKVVWTVTKRGFNRPFFLGVEVANWAYDLAALVEAVEEGVTTLTNALSVATGPHQTARAWMEYRTKVLNLFSFPPRETKALEMLFFRLMDFRYCGVGFDSRTWALEQITNKIGVTMTFPDLLERFLVGQFSSDEALGLIIYLRKHNGYELHIAR